MPVPIVDELDRVDHAVYDAVAATPTPHLDAAMRRLSRAADYSRISVAASALLAIGGGSRGRRAAVSGLVSLAATSAAVNAAFKLAGRRRRPDRVAAAVPSARQVEMPASHSFPSGHTAAAVAFATGVGRVMPLASVPLHLLAAAVGYSRVHTGVHYPGDVIAGAVLGATIADLSAGLAPRRGRSDRARRASRGLEADSA